MLALPDWKLVRQQMNIQLDLRMGKSTIPNTENEKRMHDRNHPPQCPACNTSAIFGRYLIQATFSLRR
jgi:hypothetical protein